MFAGLQELLKVAYAAGEQAALEDCVSTVKVAARSIPEDTKVYHAAPDLEAVMQHGLLSSKLLENSPELLEIARPDPEDRQAWLDSRKRLARRLFTRGPNVFLTLPDPEKITDNHFIKKHDLKMVEVALGRLLQDKPDTRIYGMELTPYLKGQPHPTSKQRKHVLSDKALNELLQRSPEDLWQHYDVAKSKTYAGNVPHLAILTDTGAIEPKYLKPVEASAKTASNKEEKLYHGSPLKLDKIDPRPSRVIDNEEAVPESVEYIPDILEALQASPDLKMIRHGETWDKLLEPKP